MNDVDVSKCCDLLARAIRETPILGLRLVGSDWSPTGEMNFAVVDRKNSGVTIRISINAFDSQEWGPAKLVDEIKRQVRERVAF